MKHAAPQSLLATALCALTLWAQEPVTFRADAHTALVSFRVTRGDQFVEGLQAADFQLLEDGKPQKITFFESRAIDSKVPLDLILLFDGSESVIAPALLDPRVFEDALLPSMAFCRPFV